MSRTQVILKSEEVCKFTPKTSFEDSQLPTSNKTASYSACFRKIIKQNKHPVRMNHQKSITQTSVTESTAWSEK